MEPAANPNPVSYVHLYMEYIAPTTPSGNPRILYDVREIAIERTPDGLQPLPYTVRVALIDAGHYGSAALAENYPAAIPGDVIEITTREYRRLLKSAAACRAQVIRY